jgi:hypothetical protein
MFTSCMPGMLYCKFTQTYIYAYMYIYNMRKCTQRIERIEERIHRKTLRAQTQTQTQLQIRTQTQTHFSPKTQTQTGFCKPYTCTCRKISVSSEDFLFSASSASRMSDLARVHAHQEGADSLLRTTSSFFLNRLTLCHLPHHSRAWVEPLAWQVRRKDKKIWHRGLFRQKSSCCAPHRPLQALCIFLYWIFRLMHAKFRVHVDTPGW